MTFPLSSPPRSSARGTDTLYKESIRPADDVTDGETPQSDQSSPYGRRDKALHPPSTPTHRTGGTRGGGSSQYAVEHSPKPQGSVQIRSSSTRSPSRLALFDALDGLVPQQKRARRESQIAVQEVNNDLGARPLRRSSTILTAGGEDTKKHHGDSSPGSTQPSELPLNGSDFLRNSSQGSAVQIVPLSVTPLELLDFSPRQITGKREHDSSDPDPEQGPPTKRLASARLTDPVEREGRTQRRVDDWSEDGDTESSDDSEASDGDSDTASSDTQGTQDSDNSDSSVMAGDTQGVERLQDDFPVDDEHLFEFNDPFLPESDDDELSAEMLIETLPVHSDDERVRADSGDSSAGTGANSDEQKAHGHNGDQVPLAHGSTEDPQAPGPERHASQAPLALSDVEALLDSGAEVKESLKPQQARTPPRKMRPGQRQDDYTKHRKGSQGTRGPWVPPHKRKV